MGPSRFICLLFVSTVVLSASGCASLSGSSSGSGGSLSPRERATLLLDIGNAAISEGDATGALYHLLQAHELDPENPAVQHSIAIAYYAKEDLENARQFAEKAVESNPGYAEANTTLGHLLIELDEKEEAKHYLKQAAQNPVYREAFKANTNLGILAFEEGQFKKAKDYFNQAIRQDEVRSCAAHYYRGKVEMKSGSVTDALRDFEKATQRFCGRFGDAHIAQGMAYLKKKDYKRAREKFVEIQQLFPDTNYSEQAMKRLKEIP